MDEIARFYRQSSPTSDLGRHRDLSLRLPADPGALGAVVRGLLVHNHSPELQGRQFPAERLAHMQTVGAEAILDRRVRQRGAVGLGRIARQPDQ